MSTVVEVDGPAGGGSVVGELAPVAAAVGPDGSPRGRAVLDRVRHGPAEDVAAEVVVRLGAVADALAEPEVTVMFGGLFSSGKTTVVNALTRSDLLPVGRYAETGVLCVIRDAPPDALDHDVRVVRRDGTVAPVPNDPVAVAREVSLSKEDGTYRIHLDGVEAVVLALRGADIGAGTRWVDAPGIDDPDGVARETAARIRRAVATADVMVWVSTTDALLARTEQHFLRSLARTHGPDCCVMVVNVLLDEDTAADFEDATTARDRRVIRRRVDETLADAGLAADAPVVLVAARAILARGGFGEDDLRAVLGDRLGLRRRAATVRLDRARLELATLHAELAHAVEEEAAALQRAEAARHRRQEEVRARRTRFLGELNVVVGRRIDTHREEFVAAAATVAGWVETSAEMAENCGGDLERLFREIAVRGAHGLAEDVDALAGRHGHGPLDEPARDKLVELLVPGHGDVDYTEATNIGVYLGMGAGAIAGLGFGPLGAKVAGAVGGMIGGGVHAMRDEWRRAKLAPQVRSVGPAAAAELAGKVAPVYSYLAECLPPAPPVPAPSTVRLEALEALRDDVVSPALRTVDLVAAGR